MTKVCIVIFALWLCYVYWYRSQPDVSTEFTQALAEVLQECDRQGKLEQCFKRLENGQ